MTQPTETPTGEDPVVENAGTAEAPQESAPEQFSTMAEAAAAVIAENEAPAPSTPDPDEGSGPESKGEPEPPAISKTPENRTTQGTLDRLNTLVSQGRIAELTPAERGLFNRIQQRAIDSHTAEQQQENEFKDLFLSLEAEAIDDPAAFASRLLADPRLSAFHNAYKTAHPEVSVDTPDAKPAPDPRRIRSEIDSEYRTTIAEAVATIAEKAGLKAAELTVLREGASGPLSHLDAVFTAAVKAGIEKERPALRAEERKAAALEAQAKYAGRTIVTPRTAGGLPKAAPGDGEAPRSFSTIGEAYKAAVELENAAP